VIALSCGQHYIQTFCQRLLLPGRSFIQNTCGLAGEGKKGTWVPTNCHYANVLASAHSKRRLALPIFDPYRKHNHKHPLIRLRRELGN
jgi:hypothetical protein